MGLLIDNQPFDLKNWIYETGPFKTAAAKDAEWEKYTEGRYTVPTRKVRVDKENNRLEFGTRSGILCTTKVMFALKPGDKPKETRLTYFERTIPHPKILNEKVYDPPLLYDIIYDKGYGYIKDNHDLNFFLTHSSDNETNPLRNKSKKPSFRKYVESEVLAKRAQWVMLELQALGAVMGPSQLADEDIRQLAFEMESDIALSKLYNHGLNGVKNMTIEKIRDRAMTFAKKFPEKFVAYLTNSDTLFRIEIQKFRDEELISFMTEGMNAGVKGKWCHTLDDKPKEFHSVMMGSEPEKSLINYFKNLDKSNILKSLREQLDQPVKTKLANAVK